MLFVTWQRDKFQDLVSSRALPLKQSEWSKSRRDFNPWEVRWQDGDVDFAKFSTFKVI